MFRTGAAIGTQAIDTQAINTHAIDTQSIDIVVLDLSLAGMDGLELIRRLAEGGCRAGLIVVGAQSGDILFCVETMALAYGAMQRLPVGRNPLGQVCNSNRHRAAP